MKRGYLTCRQIVRLLFFFDGQAVLADAQLDALWLGFFLIDIGGQTNDDDGQCTDDEIKAIAAAHKHYS